MVLDVSTLFQPGSRLLLIDSFFFWLLKPNLFRFIGRQTPLIVSTYSLQRIISFHCVCVCVCGLQLEKIYLEFNSGYFLKQGFHYHYYYFSRRNNWPGTRVSLGTCRWPRSRALEAPPSVRRPPPVSQHPASPAGTGWQPRAVTRPPWFFRLRRNQPIQFRELILSGFLLLQQGIYRGIWGTIDP